MADDSYEKYEAFGLTKDELTIAKLEDPKPHHASIIRRVQAANECIERGMIPQPVISLGSFFELEPPEGKRLLFFDCIGEIYKFDEKLNAKDYTSLWFILANEQTCKSHELYAIRSYPWVTVVDTERFSDFCFIMSFIIGRLAPDCQIKRFGLVIAAPHSLCMIFNTLGMEAIHFIPPMKLSSNVLQQWELIMKYPSIEKKSLQKQFCERWRGTLQKFSEKYKVKQADIRLWLRGEKSELDEQMISIIGKLGPPKLGC